MTIFVEIATLILLRSFIDLKKDCIFVKMNQLFIEAGAYGIVSTLLIYSYTQYMELAICIGSLLSISSIIVSVITETMLLQVDYVDKRLVIGLKFITNLILSFFILLLM